MGTWAAKEEMGARRSARLPACRKETWLKLLSRASVTGTNAAICPWKVSVSRLEVFSRSLEILGHLRPNGATESRRGIRVAGTLAA
jgi:hypothetical protein